MTTTIQPAAGTGAPAIRLTDARFIDLVTFRRSGEPVATPVLFVPDGDRLLVRTAEGTGKLKRLAHTTRVELTPSDQHGRHLGPTIVAEARVLGPDDVGPALARLHRRYRVVGPVSSLVRRLRRQRDVIIEIRRRAGDLPTVSAAPPTVSAAAPTADPAADAASASTSTEAGLAPGSVSRGIVTAMAAALFLAACGAGPAAPEPTIDTAADTPGTAISVAAPTDTSLAISLCAAVSAADAAGALGQAVGDAVALDKGIVSGSTCRYTAVDGAARVSIWAHPRTLRADWDEAMAETGMREGSPVAGLGDAAWIDLGSPSRPKVRVAVFDAGRDLWVDISGPVDIAVASDAADRFARAVLAGLD